MVCYICADWMHGGHAGSPARRERQPFGLLAVTLGYLSACQLERALAEQRREDRERRPHRLLGAVCQDLGFLTPEQLGQVLRRQEGR